METSPIKLAVKIAEWCGRNNILDVISTVEHTHLGWSFEDHFVETWNNPEIGKYIQDFDFIKEVNGITDSQSKKMVGLIAEGELNYAIHYRHNERLLARFTRWLAKQGWKLVPAGNCYSMVVPAE